MLIALTSLLIGCAPQDATVDAHWFVWLAANSSPTIDENTIDGMLTSATAFECSGRGWSSEDGMWEDGYIGPNNGLIEAAEYVGGACDPSDGSCDEAALAAQCDDINSAYYHTFLQDDGYYALQGSLEPYRSEAYLNSEGDFQLTVHQHLDDGEDFRFHFTIAPDFAPVECVEDGGDAVIEYVDDSPWLEEWSSDEDGYTIYYLNAGAYQRNPSDTSDYWYLMTDWLGGYGSAKFSSDEFSSFPGDYGDYEHNDDYESGARDALFANNAHFLAVSSRDDLTDASVMDTYAAYAAEMEQYAADWSEEMWSIAGAYVSDDDRFEHKVETNMWRPLDSSLSGLDGWMELQHSWVRIKDGASFELGSTVEGDFQILYGGIDSGSRMLVRGSFVVDDLREDPWGYPFLEDEKREENGTPFCGGAAAP